MTKFWKEVIKPGTYYPTDKKNPVEIKEERIDHWLEQWKSMHAAGNRVPIPYTHTDMAVPAKAKSLSNSPYHLAGYVEGMRKNEEGGLECLVAPATDEDEENFGTRIKDVSIRTKDWIDGGGNEFKDSITHVAAVTYPVMTGQKPFQPVDGLALSLTMATEEYDGTSEGTEDEAGGVTVESICKLLAKLDVNLGEGVTNENFLERLHTALGAVLTIKEKIAGGQVNDPEKRPEGSKTQSPAPIAMSMNELQFSIGKARETDPATGQPYTEERIAQMWKVYKASIEPPAIEFSKEQQAQLDRAQLVLKQVVARDLTECVKNLTMSKEEAQDYIDDLNAAPLAFSKDGEPDEDAPTHRHIFKALRRAKASRPGSAVSGDMGRARQAAQEVSLSLGSEDHPKDWGESFRSEDEIEKAANACLDGMGY